MGLKTSSYFRNIFFKFNFLKEPKMAVQTNAAMKNKRVKLLDGDRVKIIGALAASYKLDNGDKLHARKVMLKGKSFLETSLTMRDLEDTGLGYVVIPEKDVAPEKTKKVAEKPARTKKTKKTSKSKAKEEVVVAEKPRMALEFQTKEHLNKIRQSIVGILREQLVTQYVNIENVISEASTFEDDSARGELRLQILINLPKPKHHSLQYYLDIASEAGANLKTPSAKLQAKLAQRLDLNEDEVEVSVGDVLDDESGQRYIFAGVNPLDKKFALIDIENEQVVSGGFSFFEGLDYLSDFETIMGEGLEDIEGRSDNIDDEDPELDDDLDIEDLDPLSSITDWTSVERDSMVEMIVGNYSRKDILEFIEKCTDLDLEEGDEELDTSELVGMMVDELRDENDETFEEDEEDEISVDEMKEALIAEGLLTKAIAKYLPEEALIELYNEEIGSSDDEGEERVFTSEQMLESLILAEIIPESVAKHLNQKNITDLFNENKSSIMTFLEDEVEDEVEDPEVEDLEDEDLEVDEDEVAEDEVEEGDEILEEDEDLEFDLEDE
jgi:hypothetical protein